MSEANFINNLSLVCCVLLYVYLIFKSIQRDCLPVLAICVSILTLYIGQVLFLREDIESGYATVLLEYGFTEPSYRFCILYLIVFGVMINTKMLQKSEVRFVPTDLQLDLSGINIFVFWCVLFSVMIYGSIIGFQSLMLVRPNAQAGGTFGTVLVLTSGINAVVPIVLRRGNLLTIFSLMLCTFILYLSGTRIYIIYLGFVVLMALIKTRSVTLNLRALLALIIAGFLVLIVGQSAKEYYGENIVFDRFSDALEYTIDHFYTAQTEAFVSFASVVQYYLDGQPFQFNFGFEILNGLNLLLPSALKDVMRFDSILIRSYNRSIIPSAANSFFQCFGFFGIIGHIGCVYFANRIYSSAMVGKVTSINQAFKFTFQSYIVVVLCVLVTRGPIDVIIFSILPIYVLLKFCRWFFGITMMRNGS